MDVMFRELTTSCAASSISSIPRDKLESFAVAEVMSSHGSGLAERSSGPWKPAGELTQLTATIAEIVDRDRYQLDDVEIATRLPPVWLKAAEKDVKPLLDRARATTHIGGRLRPVDGVPDKDGLGLLIWIVELGDRRGAHRS